MAKPDRGWDPALSAAANARTHLPKMVAAYFVQGRKLTQAHPSPAALHRFRLRTKAVRYTLELFASCYGPGLKNYLGGLRRIQDFLGALSDYVTADGLIGAKLPTGAPERIRMKRFLAAAGRRKSLAFLRHWRSVFDSPGQERRWLNYLSRPGRG